MLPTLRLPRATPQKPVGPPDGLELVRKTMGGAAQAVKFAATGDDFAAPTHCFVDVEALGARLEETLVACSLLLRGLSMCARVCD